MAEPPIRGCAWKGCRTTRFTTYLGVIVHGYFPYSPDGRSLARISFISLAALGVLTGVIFAIDPSLDLQVASFFRNLMAQPELRRFDRVVEIVRQFGPLVIIAAILPAVAAVVMKIFRPMRPRLMSRRAALFLIISLVLGPGLLVNGVLKE